LLGVTAVAAATGAAAWLLSSVNDLHERMARVSPGLATGVIVAAVAAAAGCGALGCRVLWRLGRADDGRTPARAPEDVVAAAEVQAGEAERTIGQIAAEPARAELERELATLRADATRRRFHVVVFGTGSAGKTSLINALLGRHVGATEATIGTTKGGEEHSYLLEGVEGTLVLTDTPGLSEIGRDGRMREAEARDLAARSDLLLFVVDHDLIRSEYEPLLALARQGKRSIVVLNKSDRFTPDDLGAILPKLRERLRGVVPAEDVVAVAAAPRPVPVRVKAADGSVETVLEAEPPDLEGLRGRVAAVLDREGDALRAGNLLLRAHLLNREAQAQVTRERRAKAEAVIDRFQWITAGAVFANPLPALDLMAAGAVQFQMIGEVAGAYGVELSASHAKTIGMQVVQMLLKLGLVEAATSLVAGVFKSSLVGYAAGGALQATTMAYLTHISGHAVADYFERGQSWGDGGMQAALVRQFDLNSRAEFLQEFARQALAKVAGRVVGAGSGGGR
jgi:small GTP-binding protein